MADVKNLFLGGLKLRSVFLVLGIIFLMLAGVRVGKKGMSREFLSLIPLLLAYFLA